MHTLLVLAGGFVLLAICLGIGKMAGGTVAAMARGALLFVPLWLAISAANLWLGVRAGYTVKEELPVFLLVFLVPAGVAVVLWRRGAG